VTSTVDHPLGSPSIFLVDHFLGVFVQAVASISAGNDDEIGQMICDEIEKVGPDGVLSIESSSSLETTVDVEEGLEIDRGTLHLFNAFGPNA